MFSYHHSGVGTHDEAKEKELGGPDAAPGGLCALGTRVLPNVRHGVGEALENGNAAEPPVEEVELVKRHAEKVDQGVIAAGHEEQGDLPRVRTRPGTT